MAKKSTTKKSAADHKEAYNKSMESYVKTRDEIADNLAKWGESLGLSIKYGTKEEYDDNNYFNVTYINKIFPKGKEYELECYPIEEGYDEAIEFVKSLRLPNSISYITDITDLKEIVEMKKAEIESFREGSDYPENIDLILEGISNGKTIEEMDEIGELLLEITSIDEKCLPSKWES